MICKKCAKLSEKQQDAHGVKPLKRRTIKFYKEEKRYIHTCFRRHRNLMEGSKETADSCVLLLAGELADRRQEEEGAPPYLQILASLPILRMYNPRDNERTTPAASRRDRTRSPQGTLRLVYSNTTYTRNFN